MLLQHYGVLGAGRFLRVTCTVSGHCCHSWQPICSMCDWDADSLCWWWGWEYESGPECCHGKACTTSVTWAWNVFQIMLISFNPINFSLEQNILVVSRQAFILYWELHQVWEQPNITAIICVAMLSACSELRACLMETWGCCKTIMMGYVGINPTICVHW